MLKIPEDKFLSVVEEMCACRDCVLHLTRTQVVPYRGDPRTNLMLIGEGPGMEEDRAGKAMVGRTGTYLVDLMTKNGFPIEEIYITNTVMCRPPENSDPTKDQMDACSKWLNKHIEMVDPKVILAVGRFACARILPEIMAAKPLMNNIEGILYPAMNYDGRFVIPLRHPSAILRQPTLKDAYEKAITRIANKIKEVVT